MRDWDSNFDADEIDPTGGCGWDDIEAALKQEAAMGWACIAADAVDSESDWNDERQPDEAQEWHDFDPDC